jgi:pimeloyl-ACP methyl ester carboxylesterase
MTSVTGSNGALRSAAVMALVVAALAATAISAGPALASVPTPKPTIVLVHGAFSDASGWADVTERLQRRGYTVVAPANPLRGVAADAAYLRAFLTSVRGPIVLVGHSYGGFVITNAATGNPNVRALVYVAAYAPDEGETITSLSALAPGGMIGPATLTILPFPAPGGGFASEGVIAPSAYREVFAADVPAERAAVMATSQRPAALQLLGEPSGAPAWKAIPSWYLVAGRDNAIGSDLERLMAKRIHATTVEAKDSSHVVMITHPDETARLIRAAAGDGSAAAANASRKHHSRRRPTAR